MEELEAGEVEYELAEEFLMSLRKEFGGGEEESVKVVELRKLKQGGRMIEEFKRGMNGGIQRKLMEVENPPASIEQWYKRATVLDRNWRESRREEERMRSKKESGGEAFKQKQRQNLPRP